MTTALAEDTRVSGRTDAIRLLRRAYAEIERLPVGYEFSALWLVHLVIRGSEGDFREFHRITNRALYKLDKEERLIQRSDPVCRMDMWIRIDDDND